MKLSDYFEKTVGRGVLSTADASGRVNAAIYSRPYVVDDETVAFIMAERLTHANLQETPYAAYLFMESTQGVAGIRLYLKKLREESDDDLAEHICRRCDYTLQKGEMTRHIVFFHIEKVLPLIGGGT
jgi:hypothetical protein